jgi:hypothetical protein
MMGQFGTMYSLMIVAALTASGLAAAPLPVSENAARLCYNRVETREKVAAHGLRESLVLLREASSELGGRSAQCAPLSHQGPIRV